MQLEIASLSLQRLLKLHAELNEELRRRGVARSSNNPVGDLAEFLFCQTFGWTQASNSETGYDASKEGVRFQIKGRRLHHRNASRQLSAIRNLAAGHFDFLA
ncbi:MAG: hypothetical protein WD076_08775, partial [Parvularculaceae bacterium]